jgi:hypothetical protein
MGNYIDYNIRLLLKSLCWSQSMLSCKIRFWLCIVPASWKVRGMVS